VEAAGGRHGLLARSELVADAVDLDGQLPFQHPETLAVGEVVVRVTFPPGATSSSTSVRAPPVCSLVSRKVAASRWTGFQILRARPSTGDEVISASEGPSHP
jgi:hypothetical protein